jgi:diacylglycerol kinase family enzyme
MTYIIKNKDCWHLKNFIKKEKVDKIYIIICGGDGTMEWVIEESLKA